MTSLVSANTKRVGQGGFGTLGSLIPAESFFFDDVNDVNAIWRGEITRFPSGKLFAFNDGAFTYEGADSSFDYTVYKDGAAVGSFTVTLGSGGVASYTLTCDSVADSHSAQGAMFYRGYNLIAEQIADNHIASDVTLIGGPISYLISCDAVIDTHSQGNVILRYSPPSDPIDYGMSSFGHNTQWRKSQFFRGF